jgi:hypothetical protein
MNSVRLAIARRQGVGSVDDDVRLAASASFGRREASKQSDGIAGDHD